MNSKYIILLSHYPIKTFNEPYINEFNIVYHNGAEWCKCIRFFTHRFIHKKLTDRLITELVFKSVCYVEIKEWREKDTERILEKLIKEDIIGPVIRRFEIKK